MLNSKLIFARNISGTHFKLSWYIIQKYKYTPASCEIEDFVETRLCKVCVILRSRVLRVVCPY